MRDFQRVLQGHGFEVSIVPGPLLLATTGGACGTLKAMPLSVDTTGDVITELLTKAWRRLNSSPMCVDKFSDPDLDLPPGKTPKWSTHSLRRLADTTARRYAKQMEVSEPQIDLFFGWHEKILRKSMQIHYASLSIRERMELARITGMM